MFGIILEGCRVWMPRLEDSSDIPALCPKEIILLSVGYFLLELAAPSGQVGYGQKVKAPAEVGQVAL